MPVAAAIAARAERFAALGDPTRLLIAEELVRSDRTAAELGERFGLASNLVAHHLSVLERAGLVERFASRGDQRRRYVRLTLSALELVDSGSAQVFGFPPIFVCTRNSARSPLAAALWSKMTGQPAESAGTDPAAAFPPGTRRAARRFSLELGSARPRSIPDDIDAEEDRLRITVCDQAYERVAAPQTWIHWSLPDPADDPRDALYDRVIADLTARICQATGLKELP